MLNYDLFNPDPYGVHMMALDIVGKNKRVLEIGCATGQISRRLSENGCEVVGVELDEESARVARRYCKRVIVSDVCKISIKEYLNYFDFILFMDVLEHLEDPCAMLKKAKDYLKEGGLVVISLPNIANWTIRWNLLLGNFEYTSRGILDRTHLRFFNERGAKKLLEEAGFEIVKYDISPSLPMVRGVAGFMHYISKLRPNLFAIQFLLVTRAKVSVAENQNESKGGPDGI